MRSGRIWCRDDWLLTFSFRTYQIHLTVPLPRSEHKAAGRDSLAFRVAQTRALAIWVAQTHRCTDAPPSSSAVRKAAHGKLFWPRSASLHRRVGCYAFARSHIRYVLLFLAAPCTIDLLEPRKPKLEPSRAEPLVPSQAVFELSHFLSRLVFESRSSPFLSQVRAVLEPN